MPDTPELIPRFHYSKSWEDPADYATHQNNEVQNRRDLQSLFTEIATYVNGVLLPRAEQLLTEGGGGGSGDGSGSGSGGGYVLADEYLPLSGGTMRGILRLYRNPALNAEAATKEYVDEETGRVRTDMDGNMTAISQRADEIELIAQNNKGDIATLSVRADSITSRVADAEGDISTLQQTAESLSSRITNAEGDVSTLKQTAASLTSRITDAEGDVSTLQQTANSLTSRITNAEGNVSTLQQTANSLTSRITNAEGNVSTLQQTANSLSSRITNTEGDVSTLKQTANSLSSRITNTEGDVSTLKQTANSLSSRITDAEGDVSTLKQTATSLTSRIADAEGDVSTLKQTATSLTSRIADAEGDVSTLRQTATSLTSRVENAEGDISEISQTVNGIRLGVSTVTDNGEVYARITLTIGPQELYGYIKLDGNVQVSGQLSAEALYAGYGEVANLAVDQLITTRRVVKYLNGDRTDDNFIRAYEQNLEWVTGTCTNGTAQATNPDGSPLYWPVDITGLSRGADGYPVTAQGERIFTTTTPTSYPVQVYTYSEAIKRSISFESVNGIYSPIDRFGAGNQQGNNKAWILKTADGFDIRYLTPDNKEIGIRMSTDGKVSIDGLVLDAESVRAALGAGTGSEEGLQLVDASGNGLSVGADGYTDITGLRRPTTLDFSAINSGHFSETLDGGVLNQYAVSRDASGRVSAITDSSGHVTNVIWG